MVFELTKASIFCAWHSVRFNPTTESQVPHSHGLVCSITVLPFSHPLPAAIRAAASAPIQLKPPGLSLPFSSPLRHPPEKAKQRAQKLMGK